MRAILAVLCLTLAGCVGMMYGLGARPGYLVTTEWAAQWGCDWEAQRERAAQLDASLEPQKRYVPRVGWTACDLLAHNGRPSDVDLQRSSMGNSASWWYQYGDTHLVSLRQVQQKGRWVWVVDYVGW